MKKIDRNKIKIKTVLTYEGSDESYLKNSLVNAKREVTYRGHSLATYQQCFKQALIDEISTKSMAEKAMYLQELDYYARIIETIEELE